MGVGAPRPLHLRTAGTRPGLPGGWLASHPMELWTPRLFFSQHSQIWSKYNITWVVQRKITSRKEFLISHENLQRWGPYLNTPRLLPRFSALFWRAKFQWFTLFHVFHVLTRAHITDFSWHFLCKSKNLAGPQWAFYCSTLYSLSLLQYALHCVVFKAVFQNSSDALLLPGNSCPGTKMNECPWALSFFLHLHLYLDILVLFNGSIKHRPGFNRKAISNTINRWPVWFTGRPLARRLAQQNFLL